MEASSLPQPLSPDQGGGDRKGKKEGTVAIASFVAAVSFAVAGFIVPPLGDLTGANLYLVAQFLLVTTSIFGVKSIVDKRENYENTRNT